MCKVTTFFADSAPYETETRNGQPENVFCGYLLHFIKKLLPLQPILRYIVLTYRIYHNKIV